MRRLAAILSLPVVLIAASSSATPLTLRVASQEVARGAEFALMVSAADADSLGALLVAVEYAPDHLRVTAPPAAHGDPAVRRLRSSPLAAYPDSSGDLTVAWVSSTAVSGTDTLLALSLRDVGPLGSRDTVRLIVIEAVDLMGRPVDIETEPGVVTVSTTLHVDTRSPSRSLSLSVAPNPAGAELVVELVLPAPAPARVDIVDVAGRRIATLWDGPANAGVLRLPVAELCAGCPPGLYFARAQVGAARLSRRFVRVR